MKKKTVLKMFAVLSLFSLFSSSSAIDTKLASAYSYNTSFPTVTEDDLNFIGRNGWVSYKQCDSAWGSQQLGYCSLTICNAGCAMRFTLHFFTYFYSLFFIFLTCFLLFFYTS